MVLLQCGFERETRTKFEVRDRDRQRVNERNNEVEWKQGLVKDRIRQNFYAFILHTWVREKEVILR